jgi:glycerol-3-phosphate dehydrogenase (NAD(P)+)
MIGIIGAGAFGTALAAVQGLSGRPVLLLARDPAAADALRHSRQAPRLPGVILPETVSVTAEISDLGGCATVLLAVPMQALRGTLQQHAAVLDGRRLVACCKGIDLETLQGPTAVIQSVCPSASAMVLTGPSFAADIARQLSTALTLAGTDSDATLGAQADIAVPSLRIYRNRDVLGAELGGALKNVIAIASGAAMGQGLGESARAAVMTRGFAEIRRFAADLGAQPETLMGLSGFGDLVLTCTSLQSRNYRFGLALGRGEAFDPSVTVEGVATARAVARLAEARGVEMPITAMLVDLFDHKTSIAEAIQSLLSRPLKEE